MDRRSCIKLVGLGALAAAASGLKPALGRSRAAPRPARRLIVVFAQGGWDTTYALDPKTQSPLVDVPPGGTITRFASGLDIYTDPSRPNVTSYFQKYAGQTAVVRGIAVSSVAHQECVKRMATGTRSERNPDVAAIVAHDLANDLPLPYLILGDTAFAGEYAASAGRIGATNQILALLDPAQAYPTNGKLPVAVTSGEQALLDRFATASLDRARATRGATGYNRRRIEDFSTAITRARRLVDARAGFGERGRTLALDSQVDLAIGALSDGIAHCAMLNTRLAWDTHDTNTDQAGFHETTFASLTRLLDGLAARRGKRPGTTMLDDTVVMCVSEFSRTPKLNTNLGKDHWPVATAVIAGAGVRGGQSYGATSDSVEAQPIDFATGAASASGDVLMYQHVAAGVLALCGVDPSTRFTDSKVFDAFARP